MSFEDINGKGNLKNSKEFKLIYGLDPDKVYITEKPEDPYTVPIFNSFTLTIANPEDSASIIFKSNKGLAIKDKLSGIEESEANDDLSYFLIEFPWGEDTKDLTSINNADEITCSPVPDNDSWEAEKYIVKEKGICQWTLHPKKETILGPEESISFIFSKIKSTAKPGMTYMSIRNSNIYGRDGTGDSKILDETHKLVVYKEYAELDIVSFQAVPGTIGKGRNSTLSWQVVGAHSCTLDPGNRSVKPADQMTVTADETMNYTLTAKDSKGRVKSSAVTLYVVKPVINSFTASTSDPINLGEKVTLSWNTSFASSCKIEPEVGELTDLDSGQKEVMPVNTTAYKLTCQGFNGPVSQSVNVVVNSVEIKSFTINPTVTNPGDEAELNWKTNNSTSASIDQQIGNVDIPTGSKKVKPMRDISYTLTCSGPNGPVHSTVNLPVNCVKIIYLMYGYPTERTTSEKVIDLKSEGTLKAGGGHTVTISWATERATSVELKDLESGAILSTSTLSTSTLSTSTKESYNINIPSGTAKPVCGTVRLTCYGPGGPVSQDIGYS